jgi:hypothetical protein
MKVRIPPSLSAHRLAAERPILDTATPTEAVGKSRSSRLLASASALESPTWPQLSAQRLIDHDQQIVIALTQDRVRLPVRIAFCAVAGHIALIGTFKKASHLCLVLLQRFRLRAC